MKPIIILFMSFILLFRCGTSNAEGLPFNIAEIYSENKITDFKGQNLILLDFWATWCGPCKTATQQMEIIQERLKNDVFIVAITDETHEVVERHMKKQPIQLMVVRDYKKNLVNKFNVTKRPYTVLLTNKGNVIWKGHPGDLSYQYIQKVSSWNHSSKDINITNIFNVIAKKSQTNNTQKEYIPTPLTIKRCNATQPCFNHNIQNVKFTGKITDLIARLFGTPQNLITPNRWKNVYVHFESSTEIWDTRPDSILHFVSDKLNMSITPITSIETANIMEIVDKNKLWDKNQLRMGDENSSTFLAGTNRLQADNTTISKLCVFLSNEKQKFYHYVGSDNKQHDWDFQFIYDDLMEDELLNEFGVKIRKTKMEIIRYNLN